jgi:hypothetical protein
MDRQRLIDSVKLVAKAYFVLYLNINFGTLNMLPNWLSYILILKALPILAEYAPSALLLRPVGILLAVWEGILWLAALFGWGFDGYIIGVIASIVSLYFHFQLLTNLSDIAEGFYCPEHKKILTLRTVQAVLITLLAMPLPWAEYKALAVSAALAHFVIMIWIWSVLFSFTRSLEDGQILQ